MKIIFLHYHLRPGGVTKVIEGQIDSMGDAVKPLAVVGEAPAHTVSFPFTVVPALAYDRDRNDGKIPEEIVRSILNEVSTFWRGGADLFHIHNPTLGKNKDLNTVVKILISMGIKVLIQIHDFAEDGRPTGYIDEEYPENCHYAVINKRDYGILIRAGLIKEGLHFIPNPIKPHRIPDNKEKKDIILYPVRAIRRKNIGEAVLLSLFLNNDVKIGITLEPTSALDMKSYTGWIDFVKSENLKVLFRLGIENDYQTVLSRSRSMITTSIKEGFGLSFLEPWTVGRMLYGRLLPDICSDFKEKGLQLGHLYERVSVPLEFFNRHRFYIKWKNCHRQKLRMYGMSFKESKIDEDFHRLTGDGLIDFGCLSEDIQKQVILNVLKSANSLEKMLDLNPLLENTNSFNDSFEIIEKNKKVVEEEYSLQRNKNTLIGVYNSILNRTVTHSIDKKVLLEAFNTAEKNHLLLCDSAYGEGNIPY